MPNTRFSLPLVTYSDPKAQSHSANIEPKFRSKWRLAALWWI
jgi:hypothetical protein